MAEDRRLNESVDSVDQRDEGDDVEAHSFDSVDAAAARDEPPDVEAHSFDTVDAHDSVDSVD
jgi:hypothetical protein